ncbi:MAG: SpoVG family protein [Alistipes sp.]|nr:SpoVG family protein [Alistipes sp.]
MSGLTKVEMEFCERVPHELGRIADAILKLHGVQTGAPEKDKTPAPIKEEHPKNSEFDVLAVTNVQVFPFKEGISLGHFKGMASVILNDQLTIRGLRIMEGENGLYVGYPNDPFYKGEDLRSLYFPITRQLREHIENCVLEKYMEATK